MMDRLSIELIESLIAIGETHKVEFKEDFEWTIPIKKLKYVKTIVGLHNNEGGYLLLGVRDDGTIKGVSIDFDNIDNAEINSVITANFQPSIHNWIKTSIVIQGLKVGVIYVEKRKSIPSVAKKDNSNIYYESDIYFRYNAQTQKIKYGDFIAMLSEIAQAGIIEQKDDHRRKDMMPFIRFQPHSFQQYQGTFTIKNLSRNEATIKELVALEGNEFGFNLIKRNDYGHKLAPDAEVKLIALGQDKPAINSNFNVRIVFTDRDGFFYFQDFKKYGMLSKETEPKPYNDDAD